MSPGPATNEQPYYMVPLIEKRHLRDACIKLLNQEWPRSEAARANSLEKSASANPPMSLLLMEKETNRLVGHARLCRLLNDPLGCWIESVIIDPEYRNKGVGRQLMKSVEKTAIAYGFAKAYLSTKDKQIFYMKCGYQLCEPVVYIGCSRLPMTKKFADSFTIAKEIRPKAQSLIFLKSAPVVGGPPAPPPPPAPPLPKAQKSAAALPNSSSNSSNSTAFVRSQFMCKVLV